MVMLRFALWNIGCSLCGRMPLQSRIPWCIYLHGVSPRWLSDVPDSWWDRWGWKK